MPSHTVFAELAELGLTPEELAAEVQHVDTAGVVTSGAEAVNEAAKTVRWLRPLTHLYRFAPFALIEDRIYEWVAENRHRLPGGTQACEIGDQAAKKR